MSKSLIEKLESYKATYAGPNTGLEGAHRYGSIEHCIAIARQHQAEESDCNEPNCPFSGTAEAFRKHQTAPSRDVVQNVARAIYAQHKQHALEDYCRSELPDWRQLDGLTQQEWMQKAKAAIVAMQDHATAGGASAAEEGSGAVCDSGSIGSQAMTPIDEKALEAAELALTSKWPLSDKQWKSGVARFIIQAYLSALPPAPQDEKAIVAVARILAGDAANDVNGDWRGWHPFVPKAEEILEVFPPAPKQRVKLEEWLPIETLPDRGNEIVEIKMSGGEVCRAPRISQLEPEEKRDLAEMGFWPDYKNFTPIAWRRLPAKERSYKDEGWIPKGTGL